MIIHRRTKENIHIEYHTKIKQKQTFLFREIDEEKETNR
jgi:hypothetical protein